MKLFPLFSICHQIGSAELPVLPGHSTLNHSWDDNIPFLSPLLPKQSQFKSVRASTVKYKSPVLYLRGSSFLSTLPASAHATLGADMAWPGDRVRYSLLSHARLLTHLHAHVGVESRCTEVTYLLMWLLTASFHFFRLHLGWSNCWLGSLSRNSNQSSGGSHSLAHKGFNVETLA